MTLIDAILKKVKSKDRKNMKHVNVSPPPEVETVIAPEKKKFANKYDKVHAKVDASYPLYAPGAYRALLGHRDRLHELYAENMRLVLAIKKASLMGKVDDRWEKLPLGSNEYYEQRANFLKQIQVHNLQMYKRIKNIKKYPAFMFKGPKVVPTASLRRDWWFNRNEILRKAQAKFVLFPPVLTEDVEDAAFLPPAGVKRPRVQLTLRIRNGAVLGELVVELFADVCPRTCGLFLDLLDGDGLGHGYVGTSFFRKVPGLFWSGGDVIYDNGFGCYAQRGRVCPVGAENYHFSHSMPGLLSMRVTKDDEMCGIFNITFKPLPQFDLRNEVFGRVIRPSTTYDSIRHIGSFLSTQPVVEIVAAKRKVKGQWLHGIPNTRFLKKNTNNR